MRDKHLEVLCLCILLSGCGRKEVPNSEPQGDSGGGRGNERFLSCTIRSRVAVGKSFALEIEGPQPSKTSDSLPHPGIRSAPIGDETVQNGPESVRIFSQDDIEFTPDFFTLDPGKKWQIEAVLRSTQSGLASYYAIGSKGGRCDGIINSGFLGHLKVQPVRLGYDKAQILTIDIVDNAGNPLPMEVPLFVYLQTGDGFLSRLSLASGRDKGPVRGVAESSVRIQTRSSSTDQFSLTSLNLWGGPIHLRTIATTQPGAPAVAVENFTFESDPAWWVPISLAIAGGMLYGMYSLAQDSDLSSHWKYVVPLQIVTAFVAGLLAYLTANLDLLGLKLDPNVLRTYPLLGFFFAYIGIDRVFAMRHKAESPKRRRDRVVASDNDI